MATRKKAPSKKTTSKKKSSGTSKVTKLYPDGTPVDPATGEALQDVKISPKKGKRIPLDKESARVSKQHNDVMRRKSIGEPNVRWNSDYRIRFGQVKSFHPHAKVAFRQISPVEDENIPARDISVFRDYDEVIRYVRESHWKGEQATYKWVVYDDANPQWATGQIHFAADQSVADAKSNGKKEAMSQQPPWGGYPPPPGGYPPPGYGYPPPNGGAPMPPAGGYPPQQYSGAHGTPYPQTVPQQPAFAPTPSQPQPPQPPPPAPQPQPQVASEPEQPSQQSQQPPPQQQQASQPNLSDTVLSGLMQQLQYLMHENAHLKTQNQQPQQPQQQQQPAQQQFPPGYFEWLAQQGMMPGMAGVPGMPGVGVAGVSVMPGMQGVPGTTPPGLHGMPQQQQQQQPPPQQHAQHPPQEQQAERPPTVTEQVRDTMGLILELNNLGKAFTQKLNSGEEEETKPNPTEEKPDEPPFPVQVKEVGPMRIVAADGQIMRDMWSVGMFNADKITDAVSNLFDKGAKLIKDREEAVDRHAAMREKKIADLERLAAAKERWNKALAGDQLPPPQSPATAPTPPTPTPQQPSNVMVPPTQSAAPMPMQPMAPPEPPAQPSKPMAPWQPPPSPPSAADTEPAGAPPPMGVPIGGGQSLLEREPKPEPAPFATMKPSEVAPAPPAPPEPPTSELIEQHVDVEERQEEMHPAVAFAIESDKKEAGEFVMPKNPEPINTAEPEYEKKETAHPAVALAEAEARGEPPPLVNSVVDTQGEESTEEPPFVPSP